SIIVKDEKEANRLALKALNTGADGIIFDLENKPNFETLLKNILPEHCSLYFRSSASLDKDFLNYLQKHHSTDSNNWSGGILNDRPTTIVYPLNNYRTVYIKATLKDA